MNTSLKYSWLLARKQSHINGCSQTLQQKDGWAIIVNKIVRMEQLTFILSLRYHQYVKCWGKVTVYKMQPITCAIERPCPVQVECVQLNPLLLSEKIKL